MKKIAVFLDNFACDPSLDTVIHALAKNPAVELVFIVNEEQPELTSGLGRLRSRLRAEGIYRTLSRAVFSVLSKIEFKLAARIRPDVARHLEHHDVAALAKTHVTIRPLFSKGRTFVRFSNEDVDSLRAMNLDLAIRGNITGIMKGSILGVAKDGIVSFHHGDNHWNRGGPPGFWEVYLRKPVTGFVIQVLTESLDGGDVIASGKVLTQRTYAMNQAHVVSRSTPAMVATLERYVATGTLPAAVEKFPFDGPLYRAPTVGQSINYLFGLGRSFAQIIWTRRMTGRTNRWSVAFVRGGWREATLRHGTQVKNPDGHFFADPFVMTENGRSVCFVEDFDYGLGRGRIAAIELLDKGEYKILGPVIEEPHHLSFPFLFRFGGALYMVPEAHAANEIPLYRCEEFPLKWVRQSTLIAGISAADTIILPWGEKWWMLTNIDNSERPDHADQLSIFSADTPLSESWAPHAANPLIFDAGAARNGGLLADSDGRRFRVSQHFGFGVYGIGYSIREIRQINDENYCEVPKSTVESNFLPDIRGTHHISSDGHYTVFDYFRSERR